MPRPRVTRRARRDLDELTAYIAADNPAAANAFLDRLTSAFDLLARNPMLGRARPDLAPELRTFVIGNYLILHRARAGGIDIVRVVHGARDLANVL